MSNLLDYAELNQALSQSVDQDVMPIFATEPTTILCVDDEPNITNALKRVFRHSGYQVVTAQSGSDGLRILSACNVDLVISDMRMPEMDGATFLEAVRKRYPTIARVLLTGQSDLASTVAAINRGEIDRYIAKPWDDPELLLTIGQTVERRQLAERNRRLEETAIAQNLALQCLNASLEDKVAEQTRELQQAVDSLTVANRKLDESLFNSVRLFSSMIELQARERSGHSKRVARLVKLMAERAGLAKHLVRDIFLAGLLHDIGSIGLPERLFGPPEALLSASDRMLLRSHAMRGANLLMSMESLDGAAAIIRSHHEAFDGSGYPDGLRGEDIPFGSALVRVASDFDDLRARASGQSASGGADPADVAMAMVRADSGGRYDPRAIDLLIGCLMAPPASARNASPAELATTRITPRKLAEGMVLASDIFSREGALLLPAEHVFDARSIRQIRDFENLDCRALHIEIRATTEVSLD